LTPSQYKFALTYLANGFNATAAYQEAHPMAAYTTARMEGSRNLAKPCIRTFINSRLEARWKELQMSADEALARVAQVARADIRLLFDETGKLLHPATWPNEIADCIESLALKPDGTFIVKLVSRQAALRIVLEQTGKLKSIGGSFDALAEAIRADKRQHGLADGLDT
jgi:hypothetical protein